MEKIKTLFTRPIFKIIKWVFLILVGIYIIAVIARSAYLVNKHFSDIKTNTEVEKIHNTKLTLDDVLGKNLPPDPGALADQTIAGVDANQNGIRDDVEIAIFKAYPNSAKTRAVLLQYALALQMEATEQFVNKETVTEAVTEESRAHTCVGDVLVPRETPESSRSSADVNKIYTYTDFVENKQLNTNMRKDARTNFLKNLRSYGDSTNPECDIDISKLPN
jgi:hypothetical protein